MAAEQVLRFIRFLGVGAIGFVVDAASFAMFVNMSPLGPWAGRIIAFALAAAATWVLNRAFVFSSAGSKRRGRQALHYFAATIFSGALNLSTYSVVVAIFGAHSPVLQIAFLAGIAVGLASNYTLYSSFVFRP